MTNTTPSTTPMTTPTTTPIWHIPDYTLTWTTTQTITLFSAYYETRPQMHAPSVVLLGYATLLKMNSSLYCLVMLSNGSSICLPKQTVVVLNECYYTPDKSNYSPLYHICLLDSVPVPVSVRLSSNQDCSSATKDIKVYNFRPEKKRRFGMCIQSPMYGKKATDRSIIDFIEMNHVFGIDLFTIYSKSDFTKLANQYKDVMDYVHWSKFLLRNGIIFYYGQTMFINDCLYRNMHRVDYLLFIDIDEMIAPVGANATWNTVIEKYESLTNITSFAFNNVYYSQLKKESKPEYFEACGNNVPVPLYFTHFKRHSCEFKYHIRSKLLVKPQEVFGMGVHHVCKGVNGHMIIPPTLASMHHYRHAVSADCKSSDYTEDAGMLVHKDRFMDRIRSSCPY